MQLMSLCHVYVRLRIPSSSRYGVVMRFVFHNNANDSTVCFITDIGETGASCNRNSIFKYCGSNWYPIETCYNVFAVFTIGEHTLQNNLH